MGSSLTQPREEEGTRLAALLDTEDPSLLGHPLTSAKVTGGSIIDPAQGGGGDKARRSPTVCGKPKFYFYFPQKYSGEGTMGESFFYLTDMYATISQK
jgi:hypothetical protein